MATEAPARGSKLDNFTEKYRDDHKHPVNHVLHVGVGWPMMAAAVILLPFRPWWSLWLFLGSYGLMWFGHFAFEGNLPTIFKHPTTPFVMAWVVIKGLCGKVVKLATPSKAR